MASVNVKVLGLTLLLSVCRGSPVVHSPWGQILGSSDVTDNWTPYHVYYSIPYALPPVGNRRFQKPVEHPGIHGEVFNATIPGPSCLQPTNFDLAFGASTSEDCLTLDVFTPVLAESSNHAVIVYIHGGGFITGSPSSFPGSNLVAKDVVLVMIRYRLGPFGFLSTGDDTAKGNYGLWDQYMALQWVQKNIHAFGGDPKRVTLMGESAGSASVAYQALYEGSRGLFQRTLMQSGAATSTWALNRNPVKTTYEFAQKVGCIASRADHVAVVSCLKAAPASSLQKASWPVDDDPLVALTDFYFVPTVDGEFVKKEPMVLMNSHKYLKDIGFSDRDSLISINSNEGSLLLGGSRVDQLLGSSISTDIVNRTFYRDHLIPRILEMYFGQSTPHMAEVVEYELTYPNTSSSTVNLQDVLDTYADPAIDVPTISFADALSELQPSKNNFMYLFDHTPSFEPAWARQVEGMQHGSDQVYVFGFGKILKSFYNVSQIAPEERRLSDLLIAFLTDYAKTGNPQPAVNHFTGLTWPQFTSRDKKYLDLKFDPEIRSHPYRRRFELWSQLLPEMLRNSTSAQQAKPSIKPPVIG